MHDDDFRRKDRVRGGDGIASQMKQLDSASAPRRRSVYCQYQVGQCLRKSHESSVSVPLQCVSGEASAWRRAMILRAQLEETGSEN